MMGCKSLISQQPIISEQVIKKVKNIGFLRWCWVIREPTHKPVKPPHLSEPTLPPEYTESPSVSTTQEVDLEVGAGERRPDQPWVIARGEENTERRPVNRERD
jgi:hypothetical protein